jgi:hypothetical protein
MHAAFISPMSNSSCKGHADAQQGLGLIKQAIRHLFAENAVGLSATTVGDWFGEPSLTDAAAEELGVNGWWISPAVETDPALKIELAAMPSAAKRKDGS